MAKKKKNENEEKPAGTVADEVISTNQESAPDNQERTGGTEQTDGVAQDTQSEDTTVEKTVTTEQQNENSNSEPETDQKNSDVDTQNQNRATQTERADAETEKVTDEPPSENQKLAEKLFEVHPNRNRFFFTSDGLAFFERADAVNHAVGLRDKEVETITKQN